MKANEILVGSYYVAAVSGRLVILHVYSETVRSIYGSRLAGSGEVATRRAWRCTSLLTGREILVKSAQRFRRFATHGELVNAGVLGVEVQAIAPNEAVDA